MTIYDQISVRIIKEQELIIGPVAWEEAKKVKGFKVVDRDNQLVEIDGDPKDILDKLVSQYSRLFGQVSAKVCKDAAQDLLAELPQEKVPASLS